MKLKKWVDQKLLLLILILSLLFLVLGLSPAKKATARPAWQQKVDQWVLEETSGVAPAEFLVVLEKQADLSGAERLTDKIQKGEYVYQELTNIVRRTQPALIQSLRLSAVDYRSYWVTNMVWVRGDAAVVESLARRSDVARIVANPRVRLDIIEPLASVQDSDEANGIEDSLVLVKAPDVWAAGVTGQGVVVGGQDTGVDWDHPALKNQYRGWDGQTADHDFNWHDAIHEENPNSSPGNRCGYDSPEPCDDHLSGHGTHTMGTMVGDDGGDNQIGMAPGAKWIGCRNMEQGEGTPASYAECYEWFIAPYPLGGDPMQDGDPAKAPHVINNSWSCPIGEGCTEPQILQQVVENVRAAGIVTVHSAGNSGPSCSSIRTPAAIYDASFTVGATQFVNLADPDEVIAVFSSRGPVISGEISLLKPDITAPGVGIQSSYPGGSYSSLDGTSMAAPHVAGLVALLISANPDLAGDVDGLEQAIKDTAVPFTSDQGCGGDSPAAVPNHVYGWGRIDAFAAYKTVAISRIFSPVWLSGQTE